MMTMSSRVAVAAFASLLFASTAFAQTTSAPAATTATAPAAKKAEKPRSAESIACSKQADEKGLHGKERKQFRSDCLKEAKAAAGAAKSK
jgi:invasion protein IalB